MLLMKKTVAFLLMACMVMQLSACGSKEPAVLAEEEIKAPQVLSMEKALVNQYEWDAAGGRCEKLPCNGRNPEPAFRHAETKHGRRI